MSSSTQTAPPVIKHAAMDIYISSQISNWPDWRELWHFRELAYFLTLRNIKVRYKQTVMGIGWVVFQPFITMVVFSLFFGQLARLPSYNIPYPIFSFSALVPWTLFAASLSQVAASVIANAALIRKVFFPRILLPLAEVFGRLVDFSVSLSILLGMMLVYGYPPRLEAIIMLPLLTLLATETALGCGLWLAAINVRYRDISQIVPFLVQIWMYATPVIYPSNLLKNETVRILYGINPMVSVVEGFRWALLDIASPPPLLFALSFVTASVILVTGIRFFERQGHSFADVI